MGRKMGLDPDILRKVTKTFPALLKARNEMAHETTNDFARLLLSK